MTTAESYRYCESVARRRAKNFYYSFLLLPRPKRLAMCAIYAFMRRCDDISDDPAEGGRPALERWRAELDRVLAGGPGQHPLWPAFHDTVTLYGIPARYFHEMIEGVGGDLETREIRNFDDLYRYCYLVASVVGLTIIHIFGFEDPRALELAEKCGIAFQLTNIIRDVKEDQSLGRVYLPASELAEFQVSRHTLSGPLTPQLEGLLRHTAARAARYYEDSRPLLGLIHADSRRALWALVEIYSRLLARIESRGFDVFTSRLRLSTAEKLGILLRACVASPGA